MLRIKSWFLLLIGLVASSQVLGIVQHDNTIKPNSFMLEHHQQEIKHTARDIDTDDTNGKSKTHLVIKGRKDRRKVRRKEPLQTSEDETKDDEAEPNSSSSSSQSPEAEATPKGRPPNQWDPKPHGVLGLIQGETYHSKDEPDNDLVPSINDLTGSDGSLLGRK